MTRTRTIVTGLLTATACLIGMGLVGGIETAEAAPAPAEVTSSPAEQAFFDDAYALCKGDLKDWDNSDTASAMTPESTSLVVLGEHHAVMYGRTPVSTWVCTLGIDTDGAPDGPYTEALPLNAYEPSSDDAEA